MKPSVVLVDSDPLEAMALCDLYVQSDIQYIVILQCFVLIFCLYHNHLDLVSLRRKIPIIVP